MMAAAADLVFAHQVRDRYQNSKIIQVGQEASANLWINSFSLSFSFLIFCKADVFYCLSTSSYFKSFKNTIQLKEIINNKQ